MILSLSPETPTIFRKQRHPYNPSLNEKVREKIIKAALKKKLKVN